MAARPTICPECNRQITTGRRAKGLDICSYCAHKLPRVRSKQRRMRTCLSCDNEFNSTGPGNRICPNCAGRGRRTRTDDELVSSVGRPRHPVASP